MLLKKSIAIVLTVAALGAQAQTKTTKDAFVLSYELEAVKKYDAAITALNGGYEASSYETNLRMGWLHYMAGKYKESVVFYQKSIALMPAAVEPKWSVIAPLTVLESWKELEKNYVAILSVDPKNSMASYNLGLINYYRKDYVTAKKHFDVSLNLYPFDYNSMLMSAWTNYFLGNKNDATVLFNKTLLYSPKDKSAMEGLSLIK